MSAPKNLKEAVERARNEINTLVEFEHITSADACVFVDSLQHCFAQIFQKEMFETDNCSLKASLKRIWDRILE